MQRRRFGPAGRGFFGCGTAAASQASNHYAFKHDRCTAGYDAGNYNPRSCNAGSDDPGSYNANRYDSSNHNSDSDDTHSYRGSRRRETRSVYQ